MMCWQPDLNQVPREDEKEFCHFALPPPPLVHSHRAAGAEALLLWSETTMLSSLRPTATTLNLTRL
jgi:hypothetical protein